ncbi:hypothetical protein L917_04508 [Phytophthora nicotianae]|uniref:Uncharacterized protein n=3 Tax=Phytophthora nicotianae TaxID=4792 RepID=W2QG28_PHYN3|nr:hypothetical protein PPTG_09051 [Phytophthora nicotianae INRA-310]ETL98420.1 hypothetical protein L917_04508 [Phytophthora nicotianae]ETN12143.1 hypothetical protein PPTG_09051 [Phytophthora nicotianae INRA-310]ETO80730.1 hypothetical protein F444_04835 [Phytophthora nicotianae P1976]
MIKRRRKWRQQEREKAVRNVFEAQMHMRMRRQSLKHAEIREVQEVEADCVTLDLGSARSRDSCLAPEQQTKDKTNDVRLAQWVPHSIEEELSSPTSSDGSGNVIGMDSARPDEDLVLKVRQPLTQDAKFRLGRLGGLDMSRAVPAFVYRVFLAGEHQYSGDATEGSTGVYRVPRLLHNSKANLPSRPAHCYV